MHNQCRRCGKEADAVQMYCQKCREAVGSIQPKAIWLSAGLFSALLLALAGVLLWHGHAATWDLSWGRMMGRPAATINGEAIDRREFRARAAASRRILERQFGKDIFSGKEGETKLLFLQKQLLEKMIEECLIVQEAKRLQITISNEQVEQQLRRIGEEIYGAPDDLRKRLREDGITEEGLKNSIRTLLATQAVRKIKSLSIEPGVAQEISFAVWLAESKKAAKVVVYDTSSATVSTPAWVGGCCDSFSGCGDRGSAAGH